MVDYLSPDKEFNMLSLQDLLEARDLYHAHLIHKANVVATAIGRYLIRKKDPWPRSRREHNNQTKRDRSKVKKARTLENSEVRPYSWPCILVFVDKWIDRDKFGHDVRPDEMVPNAIYMPDGRVVPICVVKASLEEDVPGTVEDVTFPKDLIGGGYPVMADVQHQQHVASIGCMVTDGHLVYALTNRHVVGEPGEIVYSMLNGKMVDIGKSSKKQLSRLLFQDVYAGWPGKNVYVNLDIGLIEVSNLNQWTAQVFGIGQIGKLADLSINNISLKLIDCPVRAFGCASKETYGQIYALFYRYKSVGGFEYVADFLIGARREKDDDKRKKSATKGKRTAKGKQDQKSDKPFATKPGDSGTLWLLETDDPKTGLMPMAVQWGGHVFVDGSNAQKSKATFALATCLSTVCNLLEVDVIRDWNIGHPQYWGEMGHYTIGAKACTLIKNTNLRRLMTANLSNIGFDDLILKAKTRKYKHKKDEDPEKPAFVPLADVADNVWRPGEGKLFARPKDDNNHFADMDQKGFGQFANKTLLDLCKDPTKVNPKVWSKFYKSLEGHGLGKISPGALPFRVWQIYEEMVKFVKNGQVTEFVCAAGLLAHYIGDACQPLHISRLHHGDVKPSDDKKTRTAKGAVHSIYETRMLDIYRNRGLNGENDNQEGLIDGINAELTGKKAKADVTGGHEAAVSVVKLMMDTVATLSPAQIVKVFPLFKSADEQAATLWKSFKWGTIQCIAGGCLRLASLWESAWAEGQGDKIDKQELVEINPLDLQHLYQDETFLESLTIDEY